MKFLLSTILILFSIALQSQQNALYSQYMLDKYQLNPAYGGMERSLHINAVVRSQWSGIPDNPKSQYINAHMPFYIWNGSIGFSLQNETSGALRNLTATGSYNYVYVSPIGLISAGGSLGIIQKSIDGRALITPDGSYTDNTISHNDPALLNIDYAGITPTWTIGGYLKNKQFEFGLAIANVPAPALTAGNSQIKIGTVGTLYAEYTHNVNVEWEVTPNILLRSDLIETQTDIAIMGRYNNQIFGSIGIRGYNANSLDALIFMAGTKLSNKYSVAYSFDSGLSALKRFNEGSHEVRLIYNLNRPVATGLPPKIIYNPRFL